MSWSDADLQSVLQRGHVRVIGEAPRPQQAGAVYHAPVGIYGEVGHAVSLFPPEGISLVLPYPPSSNHLYTTGRDARRHLSAAGVGYHRLVGQAVLVQWPREIARPLHGRLTVTVQVYPSDRRRRDVGNIEKATMDSLTKAGVWEDDVQIDELHLYRRAVVAVGYVEVRIQQTKGD